MSTTLETLQAEVVRLSPADRARLLDRLIASLDADAEVEAAWDALADRREAEMDAGTVQPCHWPLRFHDWKHSVIYQLRANEVRILVVKHDRKRPGHGGTRI